MQLLQQLLTHSSATAATGKQPRQNQQQHTSRQQRADLHMCISLRGLSNLYIFVMVWFHDCIY